MKKLTLIVLTSLIFYITGCAQIEQIFSPVTCDCDDSCVMDSINKISQQTIKSNVVIEGYLSQFGYLSAVTSVQGSGVIVKEEEGYFYVLTNFHVVESSSDVELTYMVTGSLTNIQHRAELICFNKDVDLALMKFTTIDVDSFEPIVIAESEVTIGEYIYAVGAPMGQRNSITVGHVLSFTEMDNVTYEVIEHDAPLNNGNSGGMLVNNDMKLVGINTWGITVDNEEEKVYGGAIPLSIIKPFLESAYKI